MPDATAWIVVSPKSGAFGSDHFTPTHLLVFSESDRAWWTLASLKEPKERVTEWIPSSPQTFVHDAVLMMAVHVFEDEQILEAASRVLPDVGKERVDLNLPALPEELPSLYEACRSLRYKCMMVVTVLSHSWLSGILGHFDQYPFELRICRES
jgi:hypothetical protein